LGGHFDISSLTNRLEALEIEINKDGFWNDVDASTIINKEYTNIKKVIEEYNNLKESLETVELLKDEISSDEYNTEIDKLEKDIGQLEKKTHLNGEYDNLNCYLEIHPGAGGTESCDWASMLLRMYERFFEKYGYRSEIISENPGDEAGIKSVLLLVKGNDAYGYLKKESGVHRLVRISPFDSNSRRHTSFASVTVTPEFSSTPEIEVKESDLKIDVYHSSGAGGQSVNTSNSAVRITHLPTKIVVTCQNERSQLKNKLYELYLAEEERKKNNLKDTSKNIDFGNQIRNYVLEPYKLVKDLRSGYESNDPNKILDGEILELLEYNLRNISC